MSHRCRVLCAVVALLFASSAGAATQVATDPLADFAAGLPEGVRLEVLAKRDIAWMPPPEADAWLVHEIALERGSLAPEETLRVRADGIRAGDEFLVVESGRVTIEEEMGAPTVLGPGESISWTRPEQFGDSYAYAVVNDGEDCAALLWVRIQLKPAPTDLSQTPTTTGLPGLPTATPPETSPGAGGGFEPVVLDPGSIPVGTRCVESVSSQVRPPGEASVGRTITFMAEITWDATADATLEIDPATWTVLVVVDTGSLTVRDMGRTTELREGASTLGGGRLGEAPPADIEERIARELSGGNAPPALVFAGDEPTKVLMIGVIAID